MLEPGRSLAVRLVTREGAPAAGARVVVGLDPLFGERLAVADGAGELRLESLPGCALELRAALHEGARTLGAWTRLPRGEAHLRWSAILDEDGVLEGLALDAEGRPAAGWSVRAFARGAEPTARLALCDETGRFALAGCAPIDHRLELFAPGAALACGELPLARPGSSSLELRASRGTASLAGWLVGAPREASLWLVREDDPAQRLELEREGAQQAFAAERLLAGRWRLELWEAQRWARLVEQVELAPAERRELGALVVAEDALLRVRLAQRVAPSEVRLLEAGEAGRALVDSWAPDADGWLQWTLPPGAYVLELGGIDAAKERLELELAPGARLELEPELPERHAVEIRLGAAGPAERGSVARLEIRDAAGETRILRPVELSPRPSVVALELPAGEYALTLQLLGREIARETLSVSGRASFGPLALAAR